MKTIRPLIMMACFAMAGTAFAQTTPVPGQTVPQTVPQENPVPTTTDDNKKPEFNAPQTPGRPAQIPSEDTLIKGQRSSGVIIQDSLTPGTDKKSNRMNRRKNKKGTAETDDSTSVNRKP